MTSPPVDYATFCADLLPSWVDDTPIAADDTVGSTRDAARRALYRAATTAEVGIIMVIAPAGEQRVITGFLDAMTASQRMLTGVRGRVEVTTHERAPLVKDPAHVIVLTDAPIPTTDMDPTEATRRVAHILVCAINGVDVDRALPIIRNLYPGEDPAGVLEFMRKEAEERAAARAAARMEEWRSAQVEPGGNLPREAYRETSVPSVPRPMNRDELICTPEFMAKQAADKGKSEMHPGGPRQTSAITSKPRRWR